MAVDKTPFKQRFKTAFQNSGLFLLAIIFCIALMFSFIELPRLIDSLLQSKIGFPGFDQDLGDFNTYRSELYINALYLRWIGYISMIIILILIIIGFVSKRSGFALAGSLVVFLPVFGQFALSMFFLAGLGLLRIIWFPFMDISFQILDMAEVIYIPYWFLMWCFRQFGWYAHDYIAYFFMISGAFIFSWSVLIWIRSRFNKKPVAKKWLYRYSRHPQYLGWILWSYGFILYSQYIVNMKMKWSVASSLPWLLSTMIIIGICWLEEIKMHTIYGKEYQTYQNQTPFLFPLPSWFKWIINIPVRLISGRDQPQTGIQAGAAVLIYTTIFILLSIPFMDLKTQKENVALSENIKDPQRSIDSLVTLIRETGQRREIYKHFSELGKFGDTAFETLVALLSEENAVIREFATDKIGELKNDKVVFVLTRALQDSSFRVRNSAIHALGKIRSQTATESLIKILKSNTNPAVKRSVLTTLHSDAADIAWPYAVEALNDSMWYHRISVLNSMVRLDPDKALPYIIQELHHQNYRIRRNAVNIALKLQSPETVDALKSLLNDDDFEIRFYAEQALKLIEHGE